MEDESLLADVASFAADLGLASSGSGFNDADFRKKGPLKPDRAKAGANRSNAAEKEKDKGKNDRKKQGTSRRKEGNAAPAPGAADRAKRWPPPPAPAKSKLSGLVEEEEKEAAALDVDVEGLSSRVQKIRFGKDVVHTLTRWGGSGAKWYETAAEVSSSIGLLDEEKEAAEGFVEAKRKEAEALFKMIGVEFVKSRRNDSDMRLILTARRSGTSGDKVAAMTVLIQENPVANLQTLDALLAMVTSKGGKRHALSAIDVLKELFIVSLLPDRKLTYLDHRPLAALPETKEGTLLLLWWFWEDCIKERYEKFVNTVIEGSKDILIYLKLKSIKTVYELLKAKPEQEKKLLPAIVNKLGDPERKAASNAGYHLSCLLTEHPNMTKIVLNEVELFVFRPNLGMRAIYYAAVFMNMLRLSYKNEGPEIARKLIDMYFLMFKTMTSAGDKETKNKFPRKKPRNKPPEAEKNEDASAGEASALDSRLISSLLTGVNKAFRFVTEDSAEKIIEEHTPALFRLAHSTNFNVGVQALLLLHQILAKHHTVSERFYRALYSVMLSPALLRSSKIEMYISLVFKVLKSDTSLSRTCAFIKRLMQVAVHQSPELGCAFLLLLSEVLKTKHVLRNFVLEPASQDDDQEHFKDVDLPEEQGSSPADAAEEPLPEEPASDSEIHVDEEMAAALAQDDDSESEYKPKRPATRARVRVAPTTKTKTKLPEAGTERIEKDARGSKGYDLRHRDPLYCKADETCWWELGILASHIHPSVAAMAKTILCNEAVVYSGDPIQDLAFTAFLDRFAEKKPKARKIGIDSSKKDAVSNAPVGMALAAMAEDDVAPADLIFHRFYRAKADAKGKLARKKKKKASEDFDDGTVGSDDDEEIIGDDEDADDETVEDGDGAGGEDSEEEIDRLMAAGNDSEDGEFDIDNDDDDDDLSGDDGFEMFDDDDEKKTSSASKSGAQEGDGGSSDDELDEMFVEENKSKTKKNKNKNKNKRKRKNNDEDSDDDDVGGDQKKNKSRVGSKRKSLYASAEDYAHVLEGKEENTNKNKSTKNEITNRNKNSSSTKFSIWLR